MPAVEKRWVRFTNMHSGHDDLLADVPIKSENSGWKIKITFSLAIMRNTENTSARVIRNAYENSLVE